jgi:hypothetical protein
MKILNTLIPSVEGLFLCDTIEYEDGLWLVPEWIDGIPSKGYSKPARIIQITYLASPGPPGMADYLLQNPLPKGVFEGHVPSELKNVYVVIENPDIVVESPTLH